MLIELRGTEFNRRTNLFRGLGQFNRGLALIDFRTTGAWLRIINLFLLDRIIIKPWLDIMGFVVVFWASQFHVQHIHTYIQSGAIIGDGDRKSWDARGPMIWDYFSIFRTNCASLTWHLRAAPSSCRGFSRVCCHVAWKMARVGRFSCVFFTTMAGNKAGKKNQGFSMEFYALS